MPFGPGVLSTVIEALPGEAVQWSVADPLPLVTLTPVSFGGVSSYLNATVCDALLPALSVQLAVSDAVSLSGPEYVPPLHEAIPAVASVPVTDSATGWLYHPAASGGRASATLRTGGVESYWSVNDPFAEL